LYRLAVAGLRLPDISSTGDEVLGKLHPDLFLLGKRFARSSP
jgi:hypothetical protein